MGDWGTTWSNGDWNEVNGTRQNKIKAFINISTQYKKHQYDIQKLKEYHKQHQETKNQRLMFKLNWRSKI